MKKENAQIGQLTVETDIEAPPERVWAALTEDIGKWWPADFYAGGADGARDYTLEAFPGGRMYESYADGGGMLWGSVVCVEINQRLQVLGALFPNWGGPSEWYGTWELKENGSGTKLTFSESTVGVVSDAGTEDKTKGWDFLWRTMKAFVEGSPAPEWAD